MILVKIQFGAETLEFISFNAIFFSTSKRRRQKRKRSRVNKGLSHQKKGRSCKKSACPFSQGTTATFVSNFYSLICLSFPLLFASRSFCPFCCLDRPFICQRRRLAMRQSLLPLSGLDQMTSRETNDPVTGRLCTAVGDPS